MLIIRVHRAFQKFWKRKKYIKLRFLYNDEKPIHFQAYHEREFQERRDFIESSVLFQGWNKKYKKQLERGLIKECYAMDMPIIKQGQNLRGLIFIRRYVEFFFYR